MAYTERRARKKGVRYRGMYKDADGRYKSAGTYDTDERALQVAVEAEKRAAELIGGAVGGLDPVTRATRTIEEYAPVFMRHHPFHDVKTPKVPGQRAIKIATAEQYLAVRGCLPTKPAKVFSTLLVSSGLRFCEAIGLRPGDFDFDACVLEVARSVVKVSREHHPQGSGSWCATTRRTARLAG